MAVFFRILVALTGALSVLSVAPHWFRIDSLDETRGIAAIELVGRANVRADVGGIFLGIGILALIAAWTHQRVWLVATLIFVGSTLAGRFVSLALDGTGPGVWPPIAVEISVIAIMAGALASWKKAPESL